MRGFLCNLDSVSFVFPLRFTNTFCYLKRHTLVLNLIFLSLTEWLKQVPDSW